MSADGTAIIDAAAPGSASARSGPSGGPLTLSPTTRRWVAIAATLVVLVPILLVVVLYAGRGFVPGGDLAIIDARVRDVFSVHSPLVGSYSRGFNHPGPLMFDVLSPLNVLAGGAPWSTLIGAVLVQAIAIVLVAHLSFRRGGLTLTVLVLAAIALGYHAVGVRLYLDFWNPFIAYPFFALFLLEVWSVTLGDRWQLVGVAVVGSFLVQTHVGYVPIVAAGALWAVAAVVVDHRDRWQSLRSWARPAAVAAVAGAVLWIPPLVDELTGHPGNLTLLYRFLRNGGAKGTGLRNGAGLLAAEFRALPPWLGGHELLQPLRGTAAAASLWWLLVPAALLTVGFVAARRAQARGPVRFVALMAFMCLVAIWTLSRVNPPLDTYLFEWRILVATFVLVATVWAVANVPAVRAGRVPRLVGAALVVSALVWPTASLAADVARRPAVNRYQGDTKTLLDELDRRVPTRPFVVRPIGTAFLGVDAAIVDQLDRAGRPARVDPSAGFVWGHQRTLDPSRASVIWYVTEEGRDVSLLTADPRAVVVARTSPLAPAAEVKLVHLQRAITAELARAGRSDLDPVLEYNVLIPALDHVAGVNQRQVQEARRLQDQVAHSGRCRCAVIAFPARDAPTPPSD